MVHYACWSVGQKLVHDQSLEDRGKETGKTDENKIKEVLRSIMNSLQTHITFMGETEYNFPDKRICTLDLTLWKCENHDENAFRYVFFYKKNSYIRMLCP